MIILPTRARGNTKNQSLSDQAAGKGCPNEPGNPAYQRRASGGHCAIFS